MFKYILYLQIVSHIAHWDEKFYEKMVDDRVFMVTRSFTVGVPMMHRTGITAFTATHSLASS